MTLQELQEFAGWLAAGTLGAAMGVRKLMTNWAKERSTASTANVVTERAAAEIDVIVLLRNQVDLLYQAGKDRLSELDQMRAIIDKQGSELRELHGLVQRLNSHVVRLESMLLKNGIEPPQHHNPMERP